MEYLLLLGLVGIDVLPVIGLKEERVFVEQTRTLYVNAEQPLADVWQSCEELFMKVLSGCVPATA